MILQQNLKYYVKKAVLKVLRRKPRKFLPTIVRPFTVEDLKPIPREWRIHSPDFVGVASGKSGTSWWYSLMLKHPQIIENRLNLKELHYFDHLKYRIISSEQINTYCQAFASPENTICGEWSPNYLTHPFCIENLAKAAPQTKIIVLLRSPVERMISQMNFQSYSRLNSFKFNQEQRQVYDLYTIYLNSCIHSYYSIGLKELLKYFNRSQVLVLQYEKCQLHPLEEIQKTYYFLGVDETYEPPNIRKLINQTQANPYTPNLEEKDRLHHFFEEEMQLTHQLFPEIDLSLWLK